MDVSCQADDQVVGDGIHQVPEAGVAIQDIIQRGGLHPQILQETGKAAALGGVEKPGVLTALTGGGAKEGMVPSSSHKNVVEGFFGDEEEEGTA